ncbi:hypothetical protein ACTHQY_11450 [Rhodococcoides corynebacterioides]|uniref:hypothetical protein n=1 Tax=Rhodococcoides corynebacterioides TaxID=53972 RepID=UPI003F8038B0
MTLARIPAPGAVLSFTGPAQRLLGIEASLPMYVGIPDDTQTVSGMPFTRAALVHEIRKTFVAARTPQHLVHVEFTASDIDEVTFELDDEVTIQLVDITRPDLDIANADAFFAR